MPDGSEACNKVLEQYFFRARKGSTIRKLSRRAELLGQISVLEQEKTKIELEVKLFMQDSESTVSDEYRGTWANVDTPRLDTKRIKTEKPDIYNAYSKVTSSRRLTIKAASQGGI